MVNLKKTDRHSQAMAAKVKLGVARCKSIWESVLVDELDCNADCNGNHPCDNGKTCHKCSEEAYGELYVDRLLLAADNQ